jgi:IclR family transcriptional regulator, mhp operon transcriptional activator
MLHYKIKTIRALDRGLEVLAFVQASRATSLHQMHLATGLPKATLIRIIATLEQRGLVWQRLADGACMPSWLPSAGSAHERSEDCIVEVASPILERLCRTVGWPSILAVPRLDHMEVLETNAPRSYFHHIPLGPVGFRVNMLRSATGRAYLAWCAPTEREAILQRLRASGDPGNALARQPVLVKRLLEETRRLGYGHRVSDFGGHYDLPRRESDDGRDSIAVPIRSGSEVVAAVNLTWIHKVVSRTRVVESHLEPLRAAAAEIGEKLSARVPPAAPARVAGDRRARGGQRSRS